MEDGNGMAIDACAIGNGLRECFAASAMLDVRLVDPVLYRQFRAFEQQLVSCIDGRGPRETRQLLFLGVYEETGPAGVTSLVLDVNEQRKYTRNRYARIDLVITSPHHRGKGIGRLLVLSAVLYLLESYGDNLYSISCLAAHPAIEYLLRELNFVAREKGDKEFTHVEARISDETQRDLMTTVHEKLEAAIRKTSYRIRQQRA